MTQIISFSEVNKWDQCKKQYYYSFVLGYRPENNSEAIDLGILGHKYLQRYYETRQQGLGKAEAIKVVEAEVKHQMEKMHAALIGPILQAWILVQKYINQTELSGEVALVENRFLIPATRFCDPSVAEVLEDVQIGFTPDVVFRRTGGFHDVEDSKFVGRAWSQKKLNRFPQAKLYQIFLEEMGYKVSRSSIRFFNTKTSEFTLHNFVMKPGERKILIHDFMETVFEVVEAKMVTDTVGLEDELDIPGYFRRTMNYSTCQYCSFEMPCTIQAEGRDATKTLENLYVKSDYDYNN